MTQITKEHLEFVEEARKALDRFPFLYTYKNENETLIALRQGMDRDCIDVYEISGQVANFVQQLESSPYPRHPIFKFTHEMERQLKANDHKGGWEDEHHEFFTNQIRRNLENLISELNKGLNNRDNYEILKHCADIANYAMMIADNERDL